jgi:hypothetical protein
MSVRGYAAHLGVSAATVANWDSRGELARLNTETQQLLDIDLARASADVCERFQAILVGARDAIESPTFLGRTDVPASSGVAATDTASGVGHKIDNDVDPTINLDQDDTMQRRHVLSTVGGVASAVTLSRLLDLLMLPSLNTDAAMAVASGSLVGDVTSIKTAYQACRYTQALDKLAALLPSIEAMRPQADADDAAVLDVAASDLYHVLGSVLLKLGDHALALVAAERSVRHGRASHDPLAAGTSARIMTHALMSNGHVKGAVRLTQTAANVMERDTQLKSPEAAAVYGALVLRGSVAAARSGDRDGALGMLDEADRVAQWQGRDGNDRWTGFGPTNVLLHRVNVSIILGDAGAAIALARQVPLDKVTLTERKASLLVDVAQAYTQWGRHEQGLSALVAAYRVAPQEVRTRPAVRQIIGDLAALSQGEIRRHVVRFAGSAGIDL